MNLLRRVLRVALLLVALLLVVACQPTPAPMPTEPTSTLSPVGSIRPVPVPLRDRTCPDLRTDNREVREPIRIDSGQPAVPQQVIITGLREDIDRVLQDPDLRGKELRQARAGVSLGFLARYPQQTGYQIPFPDDRLAELEIRLYQVGAGDVADAVNDIVEVAETLRDAGEISEGVFADPNFITGDPWSVGGDPWSVGGDPWSVGGDPATMIAAGQKGFQQQWAFQTIQLNDSNGSRLPALSGIDGDSVQVAVFDTSPFPDEGGWQIPWSGKPLLELCVHHPVPFQQVRTDSKHDVADHGLFVAGLTQAVAPNVDLHLIRVLNEQGAGDLFWLLEGLSLYMQQRLADQGTLANTVINLSLGIEGSVDDERITLSPENRELIRRWTKDALPPGDDPAFWDSVYPIISLEVPLAAITSAGGVVVAASGNDSDALAVPPEKPVQTQIPAAYPFVAGVAASSFENERSCFSNSAQELAAPGGNGGAGSEDSCDSQIATCSGAGTCTFGLLSYALASPSGYYYGAGTSFSTPLVSGLAALVLGERSGTPPQTVIEQIENGARSTGDSFLGRGIINVSDTVAP